MISHARRRIEHVNITAHPTAAWTRQRLIEATARNHRLRYLIRDRDRVYGREFVERARRLGIETVLTPIRAPQANAVVKRWVGTLQRECPDHIIPLNKRHLRRIAREFVAYFNETRPHRTLDLDPPAGPQLPQRDGPVVAIPVLGGLHHRYERAVA